MTLFDKKNIIKIEEDDISDAKLSSVDFKDESVKKRAFINVLAARLAIKMLFSKKIEADNVYSLYTIHNVLNELDVADIYVDGIKIDVRLVFNQNEIFIPKTHFDYEMLPDLYLVMQLKDDFSCVEPLGFFEPGDLDKNNKNTDYYFFEYENLNNIKDLKTFLKNYTKKDPLEVSEDDFTKSEELCLLLADDGISNSDKLFLFKQLNSSIVLREKFVEFENFEMISKVIAQNESVLQDGILDIVGAQQVFEDEGVNATPEEVKAEVITEVLSDLILEENTIGDAPEPTPHAKTEEDEEFLSELLESTKEESDIDKGSDLGTLVTGMAIGGAIAGGISAAAAAESAINDEIIKSGLDAISAGAELAGKIVDSGLTSRIDGKSDDDFDLDDIFEQQEQEHQKDFGQPQEPEQTTEAEFNEEPQDNESEFNLDEIEELLESEINIEPEQELNIEVEQELEIEQAVEPKSDIEPEIELKTEAIAEETEIESVEESTEKDDTIAPIPNIDELIAEGNFSFETLKEHVDEALFEEKPNFEAYGINEEDLAQNIPDYVKENLDVSENIENISMPETFDSNEMETIKEIHLENFEAPEELAAEPEALGGLPELNLNIFGESQEEEFLADFETEPEAEAAPEVNINEDIDEAEALIGDIESVIESASESIVPEEAFDEEEEQQPTPESHEDKNVEQQEKAPESLFDLDDFDFNLVSDTESIPETERPVIDDSFDYESIEKQIEEEEAKAKAKEEKAKNIDYEDNSIDTTDEFLAQVDDFLNQVETSEIDMSRVDLSNIDLSEIGTAAATPKETFDSLSQDNVFDTSAFISDDDSEDKDTLQLLFNGKNEDESESEKEIIPSINKDKKMVIAASVASVVLVSLVIGGGIINNNTKISNKVTTVPIAQQVQQPTDQTTDQNIDLSQQLPGSAAIAPEQQAIPGENQQTGMNKDMGEAVSDAFSSEPVNATISKIAWEVPEDLAYNDGFRSYLQIAGKNLKLNLQNNLLLATEMAYSNKVVVNIQINGSGSLQASSIATSSGSKQIDNIVLQSVKETLMYLKMPSSELRGKTVNATLIINF